MFLNVATIHVIVAQIVLFELFSRSFIKTVIFVTLRFIVGPELVNGSIIALSLLNRALHKYLVVSSNVHESGQEFSAFFEDVRVKQARFG